MSAMPLDVHRPAPAGVQMHRAVPAGIRRQPSGNSPTTWKRQPGTVSPMMVKTSTLEQVRQGSGINMGVSRSTVFAASQVVSVGSSIDSALRKSFVLIILVDAVALLAVQPPEVRNRRNGQSVPDPVFDLFTFRMIPGVAWILDFPQVA